ncbi:MAG TPA: DUF5658 family protein [Oligoflexia bacterium]|nr:DUF5658 family protein [Oligoflexia bacterium]HMP47775.1 DUF5658 family protein [Oligoflexia bacterium]
MTNLKTSYSNTYKSIDDQVIYRAQFQSIKPSGYLKQIINSDACSCFPFLALFLFQILDFAFTYSGIYIFGSAIEANPIVRFQIENWGPLSGLLLVKLPAVFLLYFLWIQRKRVSWVMKSVGVLAGTYFFGAVLPWAAIYTEYFYTEYF